MSSIKVSRITRPTTNIPFMIYYDENTGQINCVSRTPMDVDCPFIESDSTVARDLASGLKPRSKYIVAHGIDGNMELLTTRQFTASISSPYISLSIAMPDTAKNIDEYNLSFVVDSGGFAFLRVGNSYRPILRTLLRNASRKSESGKLVEVYVVSLDDPDALLMTLKIDFAMLVFNGYYEISLDALTQREIAFATLMIPSIFGTICKITKQTQIESHKLSSNGVVEWKMMTDEPPTSGIIVRIFQHHISISAYYDDALDLLKQIVLYEINTEHDTQISVIDINVRDLKDSNVIEINSTIQKGSILEHDGSYNNICVVDHRID